MRQLSERETMMNNDGKCTAHERGSYFHGHDTLCGSPGKVIRDGICYCLRHDPERIKARQDKRQAERDRMHNARYACWTRDGREKAVNAEKARRYDALPRDMKKMAALLANLRQPKDD